MIFRKSIYKLSFVVILLLSTISGISQQKYPTADIEPYYDLDFTKAERDSLQKGLEEYRQMIQELHKYPISNSVPMSLYFNPQPVGFIVNTKQEDIMWPLPESVVVPANKEELAFYPVYKLSVLLKTRQITSVELTTIYLNRLKKYADTLHCAISLLEESALRKAHVADLEISAGRYRGPLHGIPFGVKDLLAVEGTKTTWGAAPYKDQKIDMTSTVVKKLEEAGAILIAKLTMGALAMGDIWYGGVTRNPWNLNQGSSGSSAGSASATVAGLVAFSIGTETLGSIVSPSTRCGASGLRPSYGTVSRYGAMALSWSMDKIGPICRSALDCAIVFNTIRGVDGKDKSLVSAAFNYAGKDIKKLKVGYIKSYFDQERTGKENDEKVLEVLRSLGVELTPVEVNTDVPLGPIRMMLSAEAAAAFDELTRSNQDDLLVNQRAGAWPNIFRTAHFIPAVDYINASRVRQQLIEDYYNATKDFDVIVTPSFGGAQLLITNLTGNPCVVVPNGFNNRGTPTSISFLGKLYGEAAITQLAHAYQEATTWEDQHPPLFK